MRLLGRIAILVLLRRIQYRIAILEDNVSYHLLTEIRATMRKVILQRINRQRLLVRLASFLAVKVENARGLHIQHGMIVGPCDVHGIRL